MSTCGGEAAGFSTNFDRSASLSWRYFCDFTGDKFELMVRNRVIVQRLRDAAVNRVMLRSCEREEPRVFIDFAVKLL